MDVKKIVFGGSDVHGTAANWGLAILRIFSGLALAFGHGIRKIPPSDGFIEGVSKLGFPLPGFFAWAAGSAEFFGGILLAAGLFTRPSAFFVLCTMLVAGFIRHAADPFSTKEKALMYAAIALLYLLVGAGKYGVDAIVRRKGQLSQEV